MRTSTLFGGIVAVSVILFAISLLTALSDPANVALLTAAGSLGPTPPPVTAPPYCEPIVARRQPPPSRPRTPPWEALVNDSLTTDNETRLYVHVWASQTRRLGNQLFNYASLFGIAWRNSIIPLWPDSRTWLRSAFHTRMPIDQSNAIINSPSSRFVKLREPGWAIYGAKTEQLPPLNHTLTVFLQSWKYFIHVEDQLRLDLTFQTSLVDRARRFLEAATPANWRDQDFIKVVIHVRRGDYNTPGQRKFGWAEPEPDYFNRSMAYYSACHPRVLFVVLSNDMAWCKRNIFGEHVVYSAGRRTPVDDMAIASLCDHAILTIGSYGWWAAWFAGGVTVTQMNFPTPKSPLLHKLSREDYYKPEWLSL